MLGVVALAGGGVTVGLSMIKLREVERDIQSVSDLPIVGGVASLGVRASNAENASALEGYRTLGIMILLARAGMIAVGMIFPRRRMGPRRVGRVRCW